MKKPVSRRFKIGKNKPANLSGKDREKIGKKRGKFNSRTFPDLLTQKIFIIKRFIFLKWRVIFIGFLSILLLGAISIVGFDLYQNFQEKQRVGEDRQKIISEVIFWESVINKYKGYRDAYFNLAVLEYKMKNFEKARVYLQKTLDIDPNFDAGRKLEKILITKQ